MELRKDYVLNSWVIISPRRGKRPHQLGVKKKVKGKIDFFAPGNESYTPDEIGRVVGKEKWQMRWFPNKFSAVSLKQVKVKRSRWEVVPAYGHHEIVVETADLRQLWDLGLREIDTLLQVYGLRIQELYEDPRVKFVEVFKNHGAKGGASLFHSHSQIISLPIIPPRIQDKLNGLRRSKTSYRKIVKTEMRSKRLAFSTKHFVAICPYASRFNYEVWIFPRADLRSLVGLEPKIRLDLAKALLKILRKLRTLGCDFNISFQYDKKMVFHIEVMPRIATWAGMEMGSGVIINTVAPEDAARFYR